MKSFLQTAPWAAFKEKYGWSAHWVSGVLVLSRKILGRDIWYAPETEVTDRLAIEELLAGIKKQDSNNRALVFRLEINVPYSEPLKERLEEIRFKKSFESVQPEWRALVDIRPSGEQILSAMHPKGRYNIRLAQRHGVIVQLSNSVDFFYRLFLETAKREHFSPRSYQYFVDLLDMIPGAKLFVASLKKQPLAAGIVVFFEQTATYLYGASGNMRREAMAPYLLHWEIMQQAKKRGCMTYDLGEIPPENSINHPLQGLGDFKMKFGARAVHLFGSWDYVYQPLWYYAFRVVEKLRRGFRA